MPVRFRCGHCRQLMAISKRKVGSLVPCPTCQTMIEVPGIDMATASGMENISKKAEKEPAQPLLEEDFDQVIAKADAGTEGANDHQVVTFTGNRCLHEKMIGILVAGGVALFLLGLMSGLMIARYMGSGGG